MIQPVNAKPRLMAQAAKQKEKKTLRKRKEFLGMPDLIEVGLIGRTPTFGQGINSKGDSL